MSILTGCLEIFPKEKQDSVFSRAILVLLSTSAFAGLVWDNTPTYKITRVPTGIM